MTVTSVLACVLVGLSDDECSASIVDSKHGGLVFYDGFGICNSCLEFLRTGTSCYSVQCPQLPGGRFCGPYSETNLFVASIWTASIGLPGGQRLQVQGLSIGGFVSFATLRNDDAEEVESGFGIYIRGTCSLIESLGGCCR